MNDCIQFCSLIVNAITCVAIIAAAIIYGCQLHQMIKATNASTLSADLAKRALELCECADVQVDAISFSPTNPIRLDSKLDFEIRNFGRTTAKNCRSWTYIEGDPLIESPDKENWIVLGPQHTSSAPKRVEDIHSSIDQSRVDRMNDGTEPFRVKFTIKYDDVLTRNHEITYLYEFQKNENRFANLNSFST